MTKNINQYERVFRVTGGALLASMAFWGPRKIWMTSFLIPVITGFVGTCPLYHALGINTCRISSKKALEAQANDYFPVQSDSEIAAGHPLVGSV
jgi:hypothetical protein